MLQKLGGLSSSALDELRQRDPTFPKPLKLSQRTLCWIEAELDSWLEAKAKERV